MTDLKTANLDSSDPLNPEALAQAPKTGDSKINASGDTIPGNLRIDRRPL